MIPLCENMPGGMALKPGDIVYSLNGSSIKVENTDKEGQVIMADVLCFTKNFKPCLVSSLATISRELTMSLINGSQAGSTRVADKVHTASHWFPLARWSFMKLGDQLEAERYGLSSIPPSWRLDFDSIPSRSIKDRLGIVSFWSLLHVGRSLARDKPGRSCDWRSCLASSTLETFHAEDHE